ncbi:MAG: SMC-Scp complex subunit ScpB [Desulfobacteraceae bacterium]|nr:SMC-Scp complex subunit ScpB [Desulfobacteraceae bacterium]
MEEIKHIIESLLFVSEVPLTLEAIKKTLNTADASMVKNAIAALSVEYEARGGGFFLNEVAGGYQLRTRPEYNEYIKRLIQPPAPRLSKAALETLAIIAYKQPIIRTDIEHIRGVDSGGVIRMLLERNLIRVLGRKEIPGRPLIYSTTKQFLEIFSLKDLKDLPTPKEIEELTGQQEELPEETSLDRRIQESAEQIEKTPDETENDENNPDPSAETMEMNNETPAIEDNVETSESEIVIDKDSNDSL